MAQSALDRARHLGNPWMIAKTGQEVAEGLTATGRHGDAREALAEAARVLDAMGSRVRAEGLRRQLAAT